MRSVFVKTAMVVLSFWGMSAATADPVNYTYLDARLQLLMQRDDMMGLAVAVVEDGEIRFAKGFGLTEKNGSEVNIGTRFRWASVSKGLAATVAAELDHDGTLSLDDKVSKYKTTLRLPGFGEKKATLKDVLSHRLGLVSNAYDNVLETGGEPAAIRGTLSGLKLVCPVGECHGYQNIAFDTISEVFTQVTGTDFDTLARSRLFVPLGMTTASTTYSGFVNSSDYAKPYSFRAGKMNPDRVTPPYFKVAAAGGVSSSIYDLALYLQAQMGLRPDVIPQDVLDLIHTPVVKTQREAMGMGKRYDRIHDADYALGWRVYDYEGHRVIGHRGGVRGYRSLIMFDPERKSGVVALWNSNVSRPTGIQFEVMDMIYGLEKRDWMRLMNDTPEG